MLGEKIKKYREIKGITQAEIAELLGVSPATVSKYCGLNFSSSNSDIFFFLQMYEDKYLFDIIYKSPSIILEDT